MTFRASILPLLFAASAASAEVTIRSGEHATFSRLVFTTPVGTGWSISNADGQATITLDAPSERFDTSEIFARIPRTRLESATDLGDGRLELGLNCACPLDAFQLDNRIFVVDIQDPVDEPEPATADPAEADTAASESAAANLPLVSPGTSARGVVPPLGFRDVDASGNQSLAAPRLSAPPDRVAEARDHLREEFARAGEQGLLQITDRAAPAAQTSPAPIDAPDNVEAADPAPQGPVSPAAPSINITAQTSVDEAFSNAMRDLFDTQPRAECIPGEALDVASWQGDRGFRLSTGTLNRQLYGEFDRIDPAKATELVKLYVSYGLGAEALFILQMLDEKTDTHARLATMAEIFKYGAARGPDAFLGQIGCNTAAALWAVLSSSPTDETGQPNASAVLQAFNVLPVDLRAYLGPILSEKLRAHGQLEIAEDVMRIVTRGNRDDDSAAQMELSHLALERGQGMEAAGALDEIIEDNAPPSPEALVSLIDLKAAQGSRITPDEVVLASAYALEFRGSDLGDDLQRAHVLALADNGRYRDAVAEMARLATPNDGPPITEVASFVFDHLTKNAPDATFLRIALPYFSDPAAQPDAETRLRVAERFLSLGFADVAETLLNTPQNGRIRREERLLAAELALSEDRPRNAIAQLLDLEGDDADRLRARAFEALEDFDRAQALYDSLEDPRSAAEMALLGQDWTYLRSSDAESLAQVAEDRVAVGTEDFAIPGLETSEAALARSGETAAIVNRLLQDFRLAAE